MYHVNNCVMCSHDSQLRNNLIEEGFNEAKIVKIDKFQNFSMF